MKRRKFLQSIGAAAGAAALPLPTLAKAATATTAKVIPFHYGWACVYAQMNNGVSAADISRVFRVSMSDAQGLMDRMLTRGVIYPAGLDGRSHPTRAWQPWDKRAAAAEHTRTSDKNTEEAKPTVADLFRRMTAHVTSDATYGWAA